MRPAPAGAASASAGTDSRRTTTATDASTIAAPTHDPPRQLLVQDDRAERDRDDGIDVGVRRHLADRGVLQQPHVRGVADQRAEEDEVPPAEDRAGRPLGRLEVRCEQTDREQEEAARQHLERRRGERVLRHRQAAREIRADRPGDRGADDEGEPGRARSSSRLEEDRDADEADRDADQGAPGGPVAAGESQRHDEERHRRDHERGKSDRHLLLGDEEQGVRAGQQQADQRSGGQLGPRHAQRREAAPPRDPAGHERPGHEEPPGHGEQRRDRLTGELDPEVRRSPDDVDGPEGDPDLPAVAQALRSASSAPIARSSTPSSRGQVSGTCSTPNQP